MKIKLEWPENQEKQLWRMVLWKNFERFITSVRFHKGIHNLVNKYCSSQYLE